MQQFSANGVIWDLDGTLLNSLKIHEGVLSEIFQRHGIAIPNHEAFLRNSHAPLHESIRGLTGLDGEIVDVIHHEFIQGEEHHYVHPEMLYYPDAIKLLQQCHATGLRQVIITSRLHYDDDRLGSPRNLARNPPLAGLIDAVVCGDDNEFHKPDARILDAVEHKLGLTRATLIVVGDQHVDAALAQNLGAQAILVERNNEPIPHLDRLSEVWRQRSLTVVPDLDRISIRPIK